MDINNVISVVPEFKDVEADLQVVETMCGYVAEKKPLAESLQEVKIMSGWTPESIKISCQAVMKIVGTVYDLEMTKFDEETDSDIDVISLEPFKARFDEEIAEQTNLKAISSRVMEMASALALALNIPVPASQINVNQTASVEPKKSFFKSIKGLVFVDGPKKESQAQSTSVLSWLTEPVLIEGSDSVQKLILLDNKYQASKSADAIRLFASKFKMSDSDLAEVILDVIDDARKQIAQSDAIVVNVSSIYTRVEKLVTVLLTVRNSTNQAMNYVSGK